MKKQFSIMFIFFMLAANVLFAAKKEDDFMICRSFDNVEISADESWTYVPSPCWFSFGIPIATEYKINYGSHFGELRYTFYKENPVHEKETSEERETRYEKFVKDLFRKLIDGSGGALKDVQIMECGADEEAKVANYDRYFMTSLMTRKDFPRLQRKYIFPVFYVKYGIGVLCYIFASDDPGFFAFADDRLDRYDPNSKFFYDRDHPHFKFTETEKKKNRSSFSIASFKYFEYLNKKNNDSFPVVLKPSQSMNKLLPPGYLPNTNFNFEMKLGKETGVVRYSLFKMKNLENAKESDIEKEVERLKKFCIQQAIGYDDKKDFADFAASDVKNEFNADYGAVKFSDAPLSTLSFGYKYINLEFFYKKNVGVVMRSAHFNDLSFLTSYLRNENYHNFEFERNSSVVQRLSHSGALVCSLSSMLSSFTGDEKMNPKTFISNNRKFFDKFGNVDIAGVLKKYNLKTESFLSRNSGSTTEEFEKLISDCIKSEKLYGVLLKCQLDSTGTATYMNFAGDVVTIDGKNYVPVVMVSVHDNELSEQSERTFAGWKLQGKQILVPTEKIISARAVCRE